MQEKIKSIKEAEVRGKIVLLRVDVNASIQDGKIENDFRLRKNIPTIQYLKDKGAKIVLMGHIESEGVTSLVEIYNYYKKSFSLKYVEDSIISLKRERFEAMKEGEVVLLENLRNDPGEKKNDSNFADQLSSLGDIYVNDAFSVSHRSHASIVGIPARLPSYAGFVFEEEIVNLSKCFSPERPFLFILGGAKFDTKLPLIHKFFSIADKIYISGALANDCFKALGFEVGKSSVSNFNFDLKIYLNDKKIMLPKDVRVEKQWELSVINPNEVGKEDTMVDVGTESVKELKEEINKSRFILWNGPLGLYEKGFKDTTLEIAKAIALSDAKSVVGGGDTLSAIDELHMEDKFDFVSTGGGAMLNFLADGTLPGIEALKKSA